MRPWKKACAGGYRNSPGGVGCGYARAEVEAEGSCDSARGVLHTDEAEGDDGMVIWRPWDDDDDPDDDGHDDPDGNDGYDDPDDDDGHDDPDDDDGYDDPDGNDRYDDWYDDLDVS